jgi:hypothetical protein
MASLNCCNPPIAVANGLGVDSTALLVGLMKRGVRPDLNLFADTVQHAKLVRERCASGDLVEFMHALLPMQ